tara:strand:- start:7402 stop:7566 length:165 start_codon:yes stop_codon:yes gene_type:complete
MAIVCSEEYEEDDDQSTLLLKACILLHEQVVEGEIDKQVVTQFLNNVGFHQQSL